MATTTPNLIRQAVALCLRLIGPFVALIVVAMVCTSTAFALPSINGGFNSDFSAVFDEYSSKYGWDRNKLMISTWNVSYSGESVALSRRAGYQKEFLADNILTTRKYLGLAVGGGGNGSNIVAVALAEVGLEDSLEIPASSNNVKYNTWYYGREVSGEAYPWCCAFVAWCADVCGYIDSGLFARTASCAIMYDYLVNTMGFASYGTAEMVPFGGSYNVVPGDILFFKETDGSLGHIGIIVDVSGEYIYVVEGNTTGGGTIPGGGVALNSYKRGSYGNVDRGYVVNVEYPDNSASIFNFLISQLGYNSAAASGVLANIECESGFDPTIEEVGTGIGYGLCQWSFGRRTNLEQWCNTNGYAYDTLDGQLWYMKYELEGPYFNSTHSKLLAVPNDSQGAYDAGYIWCYNFEIPQNYQTVSITRGNLARTKYWPMFSQTGS